MVVVAAVAVVVVVVAMDDARTDAADVPHPARLPAEEGAREVDLVVSHGQTIGHAPAAGWTAQIGDGGALAATLGLPVLWNLRAADDQNSTHLQHAAATASAWSVANTSP